MFMAYAYLPLHFRDMCSNNNFFVILDLLGKKSSESSLLFEVANFLFKLPIQLETKSNPAYLLILVLELF